VRPPEYFSFRGETVDSETLRIIPAAVLKAIIEYINQRFPLSRFAQMSSSVIDLAHIIEYYFQTESAFIIYNVVACIAQY